MLRHHTAAAPWHDSITMERTTTGGPDPGGKHLATLATLAGGRQSLVSMPGTESLRLPAVQLGFQNPAQASAQAFSEPASHPSVCRGLPVLHSCRIITRCAALCCAVLYSAVPCCARPGCMRVRLQTPCNVTLNAIFRDMHTLHCFFLFLFFSSSLHPSLHLSFF